MECERAKSQDDPLPSLDELALVRTACIRQRDRHVDAAQLAGAGRHVHAAGPRPRLGRDCCRQPGRVEARQWHRADTSSLTPKQRESLKMNRRAAAENDGRSGRGRQAGQGVARSRVPSLMACDTQPRHHTAARSRHDDAPMMEPTQQTSSPRAELMLT